FKTSMCSHLWWRAWQANSIRKEEPLPTYKSDCFFNRWLRTGDATLGGRSASQDSPDAAAGGSAAPGLVLSPGSASNQCQDAQEEQGQHDQAQTSVPGMSVSLHECSSQSYECNTLFSWRLARIGIRRSRTLAISASVRCDQGA